MCDQIGLRADNMANIFRENLFDDDFLIDDLVQVISDEAVYCAGNIEVV